MYCIEAKELTYRFSKNEPALNDINICVPQGAIYGFLGPNGAGKTTTLKLILGLLRMQQGSVSVLGRQINKDRIGILRQVGSLIESPSLYAHLTAIENLRVLQRVYRCTDAHLKEVLNIVGLPDTGKKKVGRFSLGMKQRLSIAIALLPQPSLLVLDEPTNGLDPNGIIEMRELLKQLNRERGMTIMISSHLLPEIEKVVTDVGIINKGSIMFQGTLETLMQKKQVSAHCLLETSNNAGAMQVLKDRGLDVHTEQHKIIMPAMAKEEMGNINQMLVLRGIQVYEMAMAKNDLETIFIDLLKD